MANDRGAGRKSTLTTEQIENARNRYEAGESIAQIAAEYGISRQGLYKRLREDKQSKEIKIDYVLEGELCTTISIYINDNRHYVEKFKRFAQKAGVKGLRLKNGMVIPVDISIKSVRNTSNVVGNPTDITFEWYQIGDAEKFVLIEPIKGGSSE